MRKLLLLLLLVSLLADLASAQDPPRAKRPRPPPKPKRPPKKQGVPKPRATKPPPPPPAAAREEDGAAGEPEEDLSPFPDKMLARAHANFGFEVFRRAASAGSAAQRGNLLLSPIALSTSLSMLLLGAAPGSASWKRLSKALNYDTIKQGDVHALQQQLLSTLGSDAKGQQQQQHAARIYLQRGLPLKQEYVADVRKFYGTEPKVLSGSAGRDLQDINSWLSQQTSGALRDAVPALPAELSLLLVSAMRVKGKWALQFPREETAQSDFHVAGARRAVRVPTMHRDDVPIRYGLDTELGCKVAQLPLQGGCSLLLFVPVEVTGNLTVVEESLTSEFVADIVRALHSVRARLSVPRLALRGAGDLREAVQQLKLEPLFSSDPDLSALSEAGGGLAVSSVRHVALLELAEEGGSGPDAPGQAPTEAAHVHRMEFSVDRPFIFVVRHDATGALPLVGRVMDPTAA